MVKQEFWFIVTTPEWKKMAIWSDRPAGRIIDEGTEQPKLGSKPWAKEKNIKKKTQRELDSTLWSKSSWEKGESLSQLPEFWRQKI